MKFSIQRQLSQKQPPSHKTDAERKPERRSIKKCLRLTDISIPPLLWQQGHRPTLRLYIARGKNGGTVKIKPSPPISTIVR